MELLTAVKRLSALAQEARLSVFRLLAQSGPVGIAAGDIARALGVTPNTLSAQLNLLANAGLVRSRRVGRSIIYSADYEALSGLLVFLTDDCCLGRAEICEPLAEVVSRFGNGYPPRGAFPLVDAATPSTVSRTSPAGAHRTRPT